MKIFLDFDDTVFNTRKFKKEYTKIFVTNGTEKAEFKKEPAFNYPVEKNGKAVSYCFSRHIKKIKNKISEDEYKTIKKEVCAFLSSLEKYIFKDFFDFTENTKDTQLYLVSFGRSRFQTKKIKNSGILEHFKGVKVTNKEKSRYIKRMVTKKELENGKVTFIDDRIDQTEEVKGKLPQCLCIRIKRMNGRFNNFKTFNKDIIEVKNLKEAYEVIKKHFSNR